MYFSQQLWHKLSYRGLFFGTDISCLLSNNWPLLRWKNLEAKRFLQLGTRHDEILLNKLCFFICVLLTVLQLEWMCIILGIVLHFFNPLVSNFKKLRMFSHNQIKHFNANIAMLRVVFCILLEMDLQSSFVTHKVLIDEFLNH